MRRIIVPAVLFLFGAASGGASAATLLVPQQYATLAQAVNASKNGDTILLAPGDHAVANRIDVEKNITIQGAGAEQTTLKMTTSLSELLAVPLTGSIVVIEGVTMCGTGGSLEGVFTCYGDVLVLGCVFRDMWRTSFTTLDSEAITVQGCTFTGTSAEPCMVAAGAGSIITIDDTLFIGLSSSDVANSPLQVARPHDSEVRISDCIFRCNKDGYWSGAISGSPTLVKNCIFEDNSALYEGGAIRLVGTTPSSPTLIDNCHFFANQAPVAGAITIYPGALAIISNCDFANNSADFASAIYSVGPVIVDDSTFCGQLGYDILAGGLYGSGNTFEDDCGADCDSDGIPDNSAIELGLVEDFNFDGVPDHCTPKFYSADVNGDCVVNGADLALVLGGWASNSSMFDINDDGVVDGADLALVLGQWTAG